ncbi:MAG TPA: ribosomal protein S18-alanine N-acetyltransferase [Candidatus Angelobacter sp.]|nr:ribosomal protein S18-alanine N-acetyltransferase [Candidatus Angelobacter sp.]
MIRVRPATRLDLPRLLEIGGHAATSTQWSESQYARLFSGETPRGQVALVIHEDEQVAGFLVGRPLTADEDEWELENIAVSGPARRRGLGSHLLGEFLRLVRERGGWDVFLEVRESNHAARALYEKWAFLEAGRRKSYYEGPSEDALILKFSFPRPSRH